MELIVAVYEGWGIGKDGTQPIVLKADRKFFRNITKGKTVICGRKTIEDFPGNNPLPERKNIVLTRNGCGYPGFIYKNNIQSVMQDVDAENTIVIGGGSIYEQFMPYCNKAYITRIHLLMTCDTYFRNLDADPEWKLKYILDSGNEDGISYDICLYERICGNVNGRV